ncbi:MAG: hypothetical protein HY305_07510 [Sphingobacteriales bacterium]|nr:hypothetical protein [Sphingobacteriales bacterium]
MRLTITALLISITFFSCKNRNNAPDVSDIKIDIKTERFDKDLFQTNTTNEIAKYQELQKKYPQFFNFFTTEVLGLNPNWPVDSSAKYLSEFTNSYRRVYDSSALLFNDFTKYENEIKQSIKYLKFYFPKYKAPTKIITYIGPLNGYGDISFSGETFIIGLHLHLGKNYSLYKTALVRDTYPEYISDRFEPDYITINCMQNIINDMYPIINDDTRLIDQMIEKGKRLYLLSKLVPDADEYKIIGYTDKQLKDAYAHEAIIWQLFVQNSFLQTTDKNIIKNYIGESPKTQELGEGAPGNIGSFAGWQIIKKYMNMNSKTTLPELMNTDAETIFQQTKYKP